MPSQKEMGPATTSEAETTARIRRLLKKVLDDYDEAVRRVLAEQAAGTPEKDEPAAGR